MPTASNPDAGWLFSAHAGAVTTYWTPADAERVLQQLAALGMSLAAGEDEPTLEDALDEPVDDTPLDTLLEGTEPVTNGLAGQRFRLRILHTEIVRSLRRQNQHFAPRRGRLALPALFRDLTPEVGALLLRDLVLQSASGLPAWLHPSLHLTIAEGAERWFRGQVFQPVAYANTSGSQLETGVTTLTVAVDGAGCPATLEALAPGQMLGLSVILDHLRTPEERGWRVRDTALPSLVIGPYEVHDVLFHGRKSLYANYDASAVRLTDLPALLASLRADRSKLFVGSVTDLRFPQPLDLDTLFLRIATPTERAQGLPALRSGGLKASRQAVASPDV